MRILSICSLLGGLSTFGVSFIVGYAVVVLDNICGCIPDISTENFLGGQTFVGHAVRNKFYSSNF